MPASPLAVTAATPSVSLAPLVWLLLLGALLALAPLGWALWRSRGRAPVRRLQALTVLTLFLTFDLMLFGAFTRLTDSGLGCPDWPGCYGQASPVGARAHIAAAQQALPSGPVTHGKAWIEMIHRYLATAVGGLIIVLTVASWVLWRRARAAGAPDAALPIHPWWPTATLLWVCLQGAFGALTVTMKLFPAIVTLHLAGGLVLLVLLCVQAVRHTLAARGASLVPMAAGLRRLLWVVAALLALQVLLGGWVSTNYAVLACTDFPTCQGSWWPRMDFAQGFTLWRPLGLQADGSTIPFAALTAIHYTHRLMAYVVLLALALLAWRLRAEPALRAQARWLAGLALLQLLTGLSNVVFGWPLLAAVLHTGGAAALALVLTWALAASRGVRVARVAVPFHEPQPGRSVRHADAKAAQIRNISA
ncbi:COX15/CtaA family protein [Extensimonas vulgaris]|uniref:Cytochrome c oxidase assembly protein subunit 15 n=1 Tax=Extensimonas vulgaris TaxID=1031594 RepID=A0A369APV0_9BURK|nr:COX15/CtaA family protein [Extensimonas vulgaris]RCX11073.1 cytochrome c oxidase assembly protein subunit 15 [Extensimonas vulgaris]TWI41746.1 cytochrome c oxidase assembly protein subunit 15 [Extensimonas vulgaris]TXD16209.1 heme A synthase [Extensimonas vulgaris]